MPSQSLPATPPRRAISVRALSPGPEPTGLKAVVSESVDRLLNLPAVQRLYDDAAADPSPRFTSRVLASLGVTIDLPAAGISRLPATGPAIVAANHPLGAVDGLVLLELVSRVRSDNRLLANAMLGIVPELREHLISVDVFAQTGSANTAPLRHALAWLRAGHCLATFPSGEVSRLRFRDGEVSDGPWSPSIAMLARLTGAPVIPVCFDARNSWIFQTLGRLHPLLRTAMLPTEMLRKRNARINVRIGSAITRDDLASFDTDSRTAAYLRARTYLMSDRCRKAADSAAMAPIEPEPDAQPIAREIAALPAQCTLVSSGHFRVLLARAHQIPATLTEIGRLRELTFRDAGEGTGKPTDLDEFDTTYRHLFIYDDRANRLVGAYRLGLTDELIPARGPASLYTATLFRYDHRHLAALTPGLELGRSFIRSEYQRHPLALLLLWQGIGHFVAANPRYRLLFGAASISDAYPSITRKLLVRFLTEAFGPGEFKALAKPTTPPRFSRFRERETELACETITSLDDADRLVAAIDPHNRGVPILLRQYLRLGARLIGFNVDPAFGDALDGLIVVDLLKAPRRHIERYMGPEGYRSFCKFHHAEPPTDSPTHNRTTTPTPTPTPPPPPTVTVTRTSDRSTLSPVS